ncbi:hypothetical protein COW36_11140 [bacterium (Candidatus Blackallbacteria) CG17_big_fil_post_rev_8_21_14_2_50_48_46]|uniref:Uncharacterized protein n=1 Tax=bacterium (Candidatus Blackallbacteria) CG17_big_fil_post_rev_8_21_14_2_50_48_46 TaxID=2014261 RepID=A0A2M7G4K6_9BACT|nr:MAG: hypothetical protein COW64_18235 [bacterium (Candidatus Blackallbacteria) CG18_big_fil_WC_8_21_14_2_50_49_26]PIW16829.1 MAG: hypothetical protein COW36_11140 [bacterium (Candidatus Blackallbacteria) CG17_big_fil_post_rev_8_21_14_2_50_48_46]PIW48026.1 MAG: hypothetical protein COW20_10855 [bacterium (Candidatus Blackallbacteria) CG13_big_fil_rev_8_21_14_2_50_49_14]
MPRIVFIVIFILVAAIPFLLFAGLSNAGTGSAGSHNGYYRRGSSFYFFDFGGRGRGYSNGGFQSGGFRFGK